ncbi:MAG: thiol peroxidase [Flavobacteriaceae bacterium]
MAKLTLHGGAINSIGELPKIGSKAKSFSLIKNDLSKAKLKDYKGTRLVLNIFPSIDTGTCAASVRAFNKKASSLDNTKVLCISRDLPFAQARFCGAEGIDNVETLSDFNKGKFGKKYGLTIENGPLVGLFSRAIVVLDEKQNVIYTEQVTEIADEPNYEKIISLLS